MKTLIASILVISSGWAQAASIPTNLEFVVKNGAPGQEVFRMSEYPNDVFVFEAFTVSCGSCGQNTAAVNQLAAEYANNPRVHVLDLGLEANENAYREWIRRFHPNHLVIVDQELRVYDALKTINQTPQVFVVSCTGLMVGNFVGAWRNGTTGPNGDLVVRELVEKALKTTCVEADK